MVKRKHDWLDEHIRGIRRERPGLPFHYEPLQKHFISLSRSRPFEAVFKIVGYAKSVGTVCAMAEYVAEKSKGLEEKLTLTDETETRLTAQEFKERLTEEPESGRKNGRCAVHFIVSFPNGCGMASENLEAFATEYMRPFAENGYSYVFAAHRHQKHKHIHFILKLNNGLKRLEFNRREIEQMRLRQSEIARQFGVELQATRFQDRDFSLTQVVIPRKHKTLEQLKRSRAAANRPKPAEHSKERGIER